MKLQSFAVACGTLASLLTALLAASSLSHAQTPQYNIGDALRQSEETRRTPVPRPAAAPVLPQLIEPQLKLKDGETLFIRTFVVEGPSLADEVEVRAILAPYQGRKLTLAQIHEAADKVTTLYRNQGYLVAKVYVPAQDARSGRLKLKLVPGGYGTITTRNESLVNDSYLQGVVDHAMAGSPYIHRDGLERAMLLMSDLAGAGVPRVAIGRGQQPGTSDFVFSVPEGRRFDGYLLGDNFGSPFTGRNRLSGGLNLNSPLGAGDRLSAFGIVSQDSSLWNGRVAYSTPLGYHGLRGEAAVFRTTYVLGGIYDGLGATGTAEGISATLAYPFKRTRNDSIYLTGNFTFKTLEDNFFDVSFARRKIHSGTAALTRDQIGALFGLPLVTSTTLSFTAGYVRFPDPDQKAFNIAGVDTVGPFSKANLLFNSTLAVTDKLSLTTTFRAQKSFSGNLDSSEQMGLTGFWGVRSFDEGLAGDSGYLFTPEVKQALPDFASYRHSIGVFADVGAVWIEDASYTTTQQKHTRLNDIGLGYYATYEYAPQRFLLLRAQVAHSVGPNEGGESYDRRTKGLLQAGFSF